MSTYPIDIVPTVLDVAALLRARKGQPMAKEQSDTTPPKPLSGTSTMSILRTGNASAKPPTAPSKSGGSLLQNKRR